MASLSLCTLIAAIAASPGDDAKKPACREKGMLEITASGPDFTIRCRSAAPRSLAKRKTALGSSVHIDTKLLTPRQEANDASAH